MYEPFPRVQVSLNGASEFACIGAINSEAVWSREVERNQVGSDIGARLRTDLFNPRCIYKEQWQNFSGDKSSFVQINSNKYSNIYSNGKWFIILGKKEARKCRARECQAEPAKSGDKKSTKTESQKSRKPEIRSPVTCHEPVSQWTSEPVPVNQWARTRETCYGIELNFAYMKSTIRKINESVSQKSPNFLFIISQTFSLWGYTVQVIGISVLQKTVKNKCRHICFQNLFCCDCQ